MIIYIGEVIILEISYKIIDINELKLAPYNPRKISDEDKKNLTNSIKKFGLVDPLIWNKRTGHVVGGNQRLIVLRELKFKQVPVIEVDLDLADEKILNLALNKVSGDWDIPKLKELLFELSEEVESNDLLLTGFSIEEITDLIGQIEEISEKTKINDIDATKFIIVIECESEEHQKQLLDRFLAEGLKCRAQSL